MLGQASDGCLEGRPQVGHCQLHEHPAGRPPCHLTLRTGTTLRCNPPPQTQTPTTHSRWALCGGSCPSSPPCRLRKPCRRRQPPRQVRLSGFAPVSSFFSGRLHGREVQRQDCRTMCMADTHVKSLNLPYPMQAAHGHPARLFPGWKMELGQAARPSALAVHELTPCISSCTWK